MGQRGGQRSVGLAVGVFACRTIDQYINEGTWPDKQMPRRAPTWGPSEK